MKNIEDWSFGYALLRPLVRAVFRLTYRTIEVEGLENIPQDKPIILAPNHQNALTDALTIVYSYNPQPVFLARADIFKKKIIAAILTFLKIMPVFRIRDGFDSLSKNDETFDVCVRLLKKNRTLSLFPEAQHHGQKSMMPHKKAIPRIAFLAGERTNYELDLYIVPVGINYTHYYRFRSNLVIRFGKPISVKEYYELLKNENELVATNALRDRIFTELENVCVHVPHKEFYNVYIQTFEIMERDTCSNLKQEPTAINLFKAEQFLIGKLSPIMDGESERKQVIIDSATQYQQLKEKLKLEEFSIQKGRLSIGQTILELFVVVLMMPFALIGTILFGWLFYLTNYSFRGADKDPHFYSSFAYGYILVLLPVWLIVLFISILMVLKNWIITLTSVVFSLICGIIAWEVFQHINKLVNRIRFNKLLNRGDIPIKQLLEKREKLVVAVNSI